MVSEALKRRIAELESMRSSPDDPPFILIHVVDASKDGDAHLDEETRQANVAAVALKGEQVMRSAGESVDALCDRAAGFHAGPEAVPMLIAVPLSRMLASGALQ